MTARNKISSAPNGEDTSPANTSKIPISGGYYIQIANILKNYVTAPANGDILYHDGSNFVRLPAGTSGQLLKTIGVGAPQWLSVLSKAATMWHDQSVKTVGNAFTYSMDASQKYGFVVYQNAAANGDTWTNGFSVAAGTYTFNILNSTDSNRGKMDFFVDNVQIGTIQDFYSAALTQNVVKTIASISVTDGYHTFKGVVNGKNASSSDYIVALTKIWLTPSAY